MAPRYAASIAEAITHLTKALALAEAELPPHLSTQHWQQAKGTPCAWAEVHAKACTDPRSTPKIKTALLALKVVMECRSGLIGVLFEVDNLGKPITLPKLGKQRSEGLAK